MANALNSVFCRYEDDVFKHLQKKLNALEFRKSICANMLNFVSIGRAVSEIWQFLRSPRLGKNRNSIGR